MPRCGVLLSHWISNNLCGCTPLITVVVWTTYIVVVSQQCVHDKDPPYEGGLPICIFVAPCHVLRRRHAIDTFFAWVAIYEGIHRWPVGFLHKVPLMRSFDVLFAAQATQQSRYRWFETSWSSCDVIVTVYSYYLGAVSIRKTVLPGMAIPMLKIRRPNGRLIFNMEIAIRR